MTPVSSTNTPAPTPLHTPRQVAHLLGVSLPTVYRLVERRSIAFIRIGGSLRFSPTDVEEYLARRRVDTVSS